MPDTHSMDGLTNQQQNQTNHYMCVFLLNYLELEN
jgi:hypothetical protein